MSLIAHWPLTSGNKTYNETTGPISDYIGTSNQRFTYTFPKVSLAIADDIWLRIESNDLEQAIDIKVNGYLLVDGMYGTNNLREWKEWQVTDTFLNNETPNIVEIYHDNTSADWGTIYEVQLYSKNSINYTEDINGILDGAETNITYGDGKIGQAAQFTSTSYIDCGINNKFDLHNGGSLSIWAYTELDYPSTTSGSAFHALIAKSSTGSAGGQSYYIDWYGTNTTRYIRVGIGNLTTSQSVGATLDFESKWKHIAATWDDDYLTLYVDGIQVAELERTFALEDNPTTPILLGRAFGGSGYPWIGKMNDARVYDHVLSPMEIQEIARAKLLHYTFNDMQEPTTNLHNDPVLNVQYAENQVVSKSNWGVDGTIYARKSTCPSPNIREDDDLMLELSITSGSNGGLYTDLCTSDKFRLEEGKTYTRSWWMKCSDTRNISGHICSCNRETDNYYIVTGSFDITTDWKKYSQTFTVASGKGGEYHTRHIIYNELFTVWLTNIQIEEKDHPTEFTKGSRTGLIRDLSSFHNDTLLTEADTPQWTNDSKTGIGCYRFSNDGSKNRIVLDQFQTPEQITMLVWFKGTEIGYGNYHIPMGINGTDFEISISSAGSLKVGFVIDSNRKTITTTANLLDGEWHLLGASFDGSIIKAWKDGENINTYTFAGSLKRGTYGLGIGQFSTSSSYGTNGWHNDVRIYATALSEKDIKDVYETRAEVEENGTLYANSFIANVEATENLINLNFQDMSIGSYQEYDGYYRVTKLDEHKFEILAIADIPGKKQLGFSDNIKWYDGQYNTISAYIHENYYADGTVGEWGLSRTSYGDTHLTDKGYQTHTYLGAWGGVDRNSSVGFRTTWSEAAVIKPGSRLVFSNFQSERKDYATPFTSSYRPVSYKPSTLLYGANELTEQGIMNYGDFSTAGIVDGLVGYWQLNKDVRDYSGNEYDGTNNGAVSHGTYYKFNGTSDYIDLGSNIGLVPDYPTFMFDITIDKYSNRPHFFGKGTGSLGPYYFTVETNGSLRLYYSVEGSTGYTNAFTVGLTVELGTRYHWTFTVEDTSIKFYNNGMLINTHTKIPGALYKDSVNNTYIGGSTWTTSTRTEMSLRYLKIFNRPLSAEEIKIEYNTMVNNELQQDENGKIYAKSLKEY